MWCIVKVVFATDGIKTTGDRSSEKPRLHNVRDKESLLSTDNAKPRDFALSCPVLKLY